MVPLVVFAIQLASLSLKLTKVADRFLDVVAVYPKNPIPLNHSLWFILGAG